MLQTQAQAEQKQTLIRVSRGADRALSFSATVVAILVAKVFWTCRDRIVDTDLGWHLRNGQFMLTNWAFPRNDAYSFTAADANWIDHSWLSELVYFSAYWLSGLRGIFIVFFLTVATVVLTIFFLSLRRAEDPLSAAVVTIFGGLLAMVAFTPRAQNFGWLFFAAVFAILSRYRDSRAVPLWLLPTLFLVWVNSHGSWPFGIAIFAIIFAAGFIRDDIGGLRAAPWSPAEARALGITFASCIAVLFVNPFGYRLVLYPFDMAFRQTLNVMLGGEWASVDFNDSRGIFVMIVLAAVFVMALMPRQRWRIDDVLLVAFALFCGLKHIRFLVVTGIVLPPILAPQLGRLSTYDPRRERYVLNAAIILIVAITIVGWFPNNQYLESELSDFFPSAAVRYLNEHPLQGNMFNQYEWGGYLEWKLPQAKTFIDSRTDIFEYNGILRDYVAISTLNHAQELLLRYRIAYILYPANSPLAHFLSQSLEWECVFRDSQAVIYKPINH